MRVGSSIRSMVGLALASMFGVVLASCTGSDAHLGGAGNGTTESAPTDPPAISDGISPEETASVSLALINVPSDAACLEAVVSPDRSLWSARSQLFAITPGATSASVTVGGLPSGSASIAARTFGVACAQVVASSSPTWVTAVPVPVTLVVGQTANVSIVLRRASAVQITATFDDAYLTVTPTSKNFSSVPVGGRATAVFTVSNPGTTGVPISPAITGTDSSQFAVENSGCTTVPANSSCGINVVFLPTTQGSKAATLDLGGGATASLTGTAVAGALTFTPSPATFPPTAAGLNSAITLTLTNSSTAAVDIGTWSVTLSTEFEPDGPGTCGSSLPASSSCTRLFRFFPTSIGSKTAIVTVAGGASVTLQGSCPPIVIMPESELGNIQVGGRSTATFRIYNSDPAHPITITPTITGPDASQFTVVDNTCTGTRNSCSMDVRFLPTSQGTKTATLDLGGGATTPLTGTALVGVLTFTPSPAIFPPATVPLSSALTLTLTNSATVPINMGFWNLSSTVDFQPDSPTINCVNPLPASSSCTRVYRFFANSVGTKTATLTVDAGASVTLEGSTSLTAIYRINAGSSTAVSPFNADQYYSGGTQASYSATINVSGVTNSAPAAVYQSERYGNMTYTFPSLTASRAHVVRLHFAELYQSAAGRRVFNVAINGTAVLTNFDTYVAAGAKNKAVVREFTTNANSSGQIVVQFTNVTDNASVSGIEILR